jgi:hypothetical protein
MIDWKNRDPSLALERLGRALEDELPSEEEAAAIVAALGIDVEALTARIRAQVDAYEAARPTDRPPPSSHVREVDGAPRADPVEVAPQPQVMRASGIRRRRHGSR